MELDEWLTLAHQGFRINVKTSVALDGHSRESNQNINRSWPHQRAMARRVGTGRYHFHIFATKQIPPDKKEKARTRWMLGKILSTNEAAKNHTCKHLASSYANEESQAASYTIKKASPPFPVRLAAINSLLVKRSIVER